MTSLLQKIRTAVLANAHDLIDKVIDLNSIGAVKQHIRDLEESIGQMTEAAIQAGGHRRTVERETAQLAAQVAELNTNIDFIITDGDEANDHLALPMEARLAALEEQQAAVEVELTTAVQVSQALDEALSTIKAKHQQMLAQLSRLEAMDRAAKAKEQAAETLEQVGAMDMEGAQASVDDVTARIQRRSDVADERFQRAMAGTAGAAEKDVALAKARARLAERKARLTGQTGEPETVQVVVEGKPVTD